MKCLYMVIGGRRIQWDPPCKQRRIADDHLHDGGIVDLRVCQRHTEPGGIELHGYRGLYHNCVRGKGLNKLAPVFSVQTGQQNVQRDEVRIGFSIHVLETEDKTNVRTLL